MKHNPISLSKRLRAAADYVREGSYMADVGTDHAYLPLWLLLEGRIRGGVVSDIHKGPIDRAREHLRAYDGEDRLTPVLCDGLSALESYAPEDICILGMGGELIARILADAPFTKREGVRLILQPMTHPENVRRFLLSEGYAIVEERLVKEDKIYQIIVAEYTGEKRESDELSLMFGEINLQRGDDLLCELLAHWEKILLRRKEGKAVAGEDTPEEDTLLASIRAYL
ncbi:MAG: SAM-dependent methyltransferase [Clostridia bacterium]|nr:SAM-dependent methyltransferase [Clostridia bacterium]